MAYKCVRRVSRVKGTSGQTGLGIAKFSLRVRGHLLCVSIMMGHSKWPWWALGQECILIAGKTVVNANHNAAMGMLPLAPW